jgi:hypothetical protein
VTVLELKARIMFQTNNDKDDVGDFAPYLLDYINEGYDKLLYESLGAHIGDTGYPLLKEDTDVPVIAEWTHSALADYATYRVYMNGSAGKQNRGIPFLSDYLNCKARLSSGNISVISHIPG